MDFSRRKLPREAALNLRICPVASVKPYALMLSPVYVFMRLNEKFVSIKGPLDFFTSEELERLKSFDSFYLPEFVDQALPFRQAARHVRALINWVPKIGDEEALPPAPYEISDGVLRMLGPLWATGPLIEPFFATVFTNEFCELLPGELLKAARDGDVVRYERALLRSGWAVFLALHLGYCDWEFLNRMRLRVFEMVMSQDGMPVIGIASEVDELVDLVMASTGGDSRVAVSASIFDAFESRAAKKMAGRLKRVREMIPTDEPAPSIFGERGFVDV